MDFDFRLVIFLAPLLLAVGWAGFNIAPAALKQIQGFLER